MRLQGFFSRWFACCLVAALSATRSSAQQPQPICATDVTSLLGAPGRFSSIAFLTDDLVLVSNGRSVASSLIYSVSKNKTVATGTTCAMSGERLWGTPKGRILAACSRGLVLYDQDFRLIALLRASDGYNPSQKLLFSATRELVALSLSFPSPMKVFASDTLEEVASLPPNTFPDKGNVTFISGLYNAGYVVYSGPMGEREGELSFHRFLMPQAVVFQKTTNGCMRNAAISETEALVFPCGKYPGEIIDVATGRPEPTVFDSKHASFLQTTLSGKRFAIGYQVYSKLHKVKGALNPLLYLDDESSNLFRLRVLDRQSGSVLFDFHWKTNKNEPMLARYDNSAVSLSPNGEYVAFLRGSALKVYRIPDAAAH